MASTTINIDIALKIQEYVLHSPLTKQLTVKLPKMANIIKDTLPEMASIIEPSNKYTAATTITAKMLKPNTNLACSVSNILNYLDYIKKKRRGSKIN